MWFLQTLPQSCGRGARAPLSVIRSICGMLAGARLGGVCRVVYLKYMYMYLESTCCFNALRKYVHTIRVNQACNSRWHRAAHRRSTLYDGDGVWLHLAGFRNWIFSLKCVCLRFLCVWVLPLSFLRSCVFISIYHYEYAFETAAPAQMQLRTTKFISGLYV